MEHLTSEKVHQPSDRGNLWNKKIKKMTTLIRDESTKQEIQKIIIDRFKLSLMSDNNSFYLFEDKLSQTSKVYYLKNID